MIKFSDRILVTGGTGLIGVNLMNRLKEQGFEVYSIGSETDLRDKSTCEKIFQSFKPTVVYHLAARVGGIYANSTFKSDFYSDNVLINTNVVNACVSYNVNYIFAMGTGCAYPKRLENDLLHEEDFLDGIPEVTNDAYAYAKRGLLVHLKALGENDLIKYVYCLPANIYGPYDNFHPLHSHVVPGLIRRFCESVDKKEKSISIWGNGLAKRDFMYIDDCIDAIMILTNKKAFGTYNVATEQLTTIRDLANYLAELSGFEGEILYDKNKPEGQLRRVLDSSKIRNLGWDSKIPIKEGLKKVINWYRNNPSLIRER